jgi:hypothetical protein
VAADSGAHASEGQAVCQQQPSEQQQAAYNITSIGSVIAAGLAVSARASRLQQLTIDAPVSTSQASQLMALLAALQHLELNQLCRTPIEEQVQQQQPWRPAHVPKDLLHLQLRSPGQITHLEDYIKLDARPFAAAKDLQSLQLLAGIKVHTITAFTEVLQLSSLTIACMPGPQVQFGGMSQLQALHLPRSCRLCDTSTCRGSGCAGPKLRGRWRACGWASSS